MTLLTAWITAAMIAVGQQGGADPIKVAVVDVPVVSERYEGTRALEATFEQKRVAFNEKRDELREKVNRLRRSLQEEIRPGTELFEERRRELTLTEAELEWFVESQGQQIEQGLAASLKQIYTDIQEAVRQVATARDIDIVLAADRMPEDTPQNTQQARQQIMLQKVVFWSPEVDITDAVVERLNANFRAKQAAESAGSDGKPSGG